jgi:DNA excision repair protein ERCC-3
MEENKVIAVQSDKTILLDTHHPQFEEVRKRLIGFSELSKTPEHIHFYRITPISLWNSAANGIPLDGIISCLENYKKFDIPKNVLEYIERHYSIYGKVVLKSKDPQNILIEIKDEKLFEKVEGLIQQYIVKKGPENTLIIDKQNRGSIKNELIKHLIPVKDIAGFDSGNRLELHLRENSLEEKGFSLRYYQKEAIENFMRWKEGSGVVVLPCGAGKTIVGIGIMNEIKEYTLIITTSVEAIRQWTREILDKTSLNPDDVGEYTAQKKIIKPVTITTYNMLIHKNAGSEEMRNIGIFTEKNWGLIIYDEVHILPAPIFRMTTFIQGKRRLGLTATLVREDNLETEVFTLIGPKIYEYSWKALEKEGWIATAYCYEIKIPLNEGNSFEYLRSSQRQKFRIASENPNKLKILEKLLHFHKENHILIIGHYIFQLQEISRIFGIPLITGETPNHEREIMYRDFRNNKIPALIVSRVGNFSIDLPIADVAIQVSGIFGSRQEEAQRLGRILRPESCKAYFYSLVSRDTLEEEFARRRQMFLLEQGYHYSIIHYPEKEEALSIPDLELKSSD